MSGLVCFLVVVNVVCRQKEHLPQDRSSQYSRMHQNNEMRCLICLPGFTVSGAFPCSVFNTVFRAP